MWKRQKTRDDMNYDALIKTALTGHLGEAVREVQRQQQQQQQQSTAVVEGNSESAHTLCCVLEALLIHRLRDSFIDKVSSVFSGDVIRQPSPNFWPFLLGFSHRHSVDYLSDSCPWLRTDIGRCRGWIRLVLNDGMFTSYLDLLAGERRLLGDFYERQAYLRDPEHLDIARKLLSGLEMLQFRLAVNSSMLNNWSTTPLLLAGLWSPPTPVVQEAVVQGVDAALCFTDEDETLQPIKQRNALTKSLAAANVPKVDEDMAFRLIIESDRNIPSGMRALLQSPPKPIASAVVASSETRHSQSLPTSHMTEVLEDVDSQIVHVTRLRLKNSRAASPAVEEVKQDYVPPCPIATPPQRLAEEIVAVDVLTDVVHDSTNGSVEDKNNEEEASTFEDLLEDYSNFNIGSNSLVKSPNYSPSGTSSVTRDSSPEEKFEIISDKKDHKSPLASLLLTLNQESNLVKQNYQCAGCSSPIGLIYGPARVCNFTGGLYCPDCHNDTDEVIIPARVFLNGDWSKRKVCRAVHQFFREIEVDPSLDAIQFDRNIYSFQREFSALLTVRSQLQHLSAFLLTCRTADVGEEFRKRIYGKEYLYNHQHTYSLADLPLIQSGQLLQQLTKLFQFGKQHVAACNLCLMKGFLCEACRSEAVIFPFDLESTFRCPFCGAVFHSGCMDRFRPCPRCERWKSRELNRNVEESEESDQEV